MGESSIGESTIRISSKGKSSMGESSIGESTIRISSQRSNGSGDGSSNLNWFGSLQDFGVSGSGSPSAFSGGSLSEESEVGSLGFSDLRGVLDGFGSNTGVNGSNGESVLMDRSFAFENLGQRGECTHGREQLGAQ